MANGLRAKAKEDAGAVKGETLEGAGLVKRESKGVYGSVKGEGKGFYRSAKGEGKVIYYDTKDEARSFADFGAKIMETLSVGGLILAIIFTIVCSALFAVGFVPCVVGVIIGVIFIGLSLMSYLTFDRIEKEL